MEQMNFCCTSESHVGWHFYFSAEPCTPWNTNSHFLGLLENQKQLRLGSVAAVISLYRRYYLDTLNGGVGSRFRSWILDVRPESIWSKTRSPHSLSPKSSSRNNRDYACSGAAYQCRFADPEYSAQPTNAKRFGNGRGGQIGQGMANGSTRATISQQSHQMRLRLDEIWMRFRISSRMRRILGTKYHRLKKWRDTQLFEKFPTGRQRKDKRARTSIKYQRCRCKGREIQGLRDEVEDENWSKSIQRREARRAIVHNSIKTKARYYPQFIPWPGTSTSRLCLASSL
ncbi:hypothetical protein EDD85DRAFT_798694 [Armillaria nabsnona]|nr:hypothetical protein EDD85DRAFT_798694 [Armillaria nabsnona]